MRLSPTIVSMVHAEADVDKPVIKKRIVKKKLYGDIQV